MIIINPGNDTAAVRKEWGKRENFFMNIEITNYQAGLAFEAPRWAIIVGLELRKRISFDMCILYKRPRI